MSGKAVTFKQICWSCFSSHCAVPFQDGSDGFQEDFEVQAEGPVVDVFRVQFDDLFEVGNGAPAGNLPQAGQAGLGSQASAVMVLVFLPFIFRRGPGADQGHVALQDVEELRELVQAGGADLFSDPRDLLSVHDLVADDPGIKVHLEHHAVLDLVLRQEFLLPLFRVHVHGADLVEGKLLSILSDPRLFEEDRSRALFLDLGSDTDDDGNQNQGKEAAHQAAKDVDDALDQLLAGTDVVGRHGQNVVPGHLFHEALAPDAGDRQADVHRDCHLPALLDEPGNAGGFGFGICRLGVHCFGFLSSGAVGIVDEVFNGSIRGGLEV